jgi:7 transmembrane receptor (rhodopsin family)
MLFFKFSILCFTVERYIGICKPLLAQKLCSVERAKKIIAVNWSLALLYCSPWLGLTTTRTVQNPGYPAMEQCEYRLGREHYVYFFIVDFAVFYMMPLLVAIILYIQIGLALKQSSRPNRTTSVQDCLIGHRSAYGILRKHSSLQPDYHDHSSAQVSHMNPYRIWVI